MTDILDQLMTAPYVTSAIRREAHDEIVRLRALLTPAPKPKRESGDVRLASPVGERWWGKLSEGLRLAVREELRTQGLYLRVVGPSWSTHRPETDEIVNVGSGTVELLRWAGEI